MGSPVAFAFARHFLFERCSAAGRFFVAILSPPRATETSPYAPGLFLYLVRSRPVRTPCSAWFWHVALPFVVGSKLAPFEALTERSHARVRRYAGGLIAWKDAGFPLDGAWWTAGGT